MINQKDESQKPTGTKVAYKYANKETFTDIINKSIPKQLIPNKKMATILGLIFLAVIIIALFRFPYGSLMTGNLNIIVNIGYPWPFLVLNPSAIEELPIRIINLILDILLYLILAYVINIIINLTLNNPLTKSKEEIQKRPIIFKDRKPTIAEKVTEKVVKKIE